MYNRYCVVVLVVMAEATDTVSEKLEQQAVTTTTGAVTAATDAVTMVTDAVTMPMTTSTEADKYALANELLQQVDVNIVKTATLRKQMPAKCAQLLAQRCRLQLNAIVSMSQKLMLSLLTDGIVSLGLGHAH